MNRLVRRWPIVMALAILSMLLLVDCSEPQLHHTYDVKDITALVANQSNSIKAKGRAQCLYGAPYSFEVYPGDNDKLLLFFQGGGLCWDQISIDRRHCPAQYTPIKPAGLLERGASSKSKFKDYTLVVVSYCTGDAGIGAGIAPALSGPKSEKIHHYGVYNTKAVMDWVVLQQRDGHIQGNLTHLVLLGASAGSIGAFMWAPTVLKSLNWQASAVILDSMIFSFPPGYFRDFIRGYSSCNFLRFAISGQISERCTRKDFTLSEVFVTALNKVPNVPYVLLFSKRDDSTRGNYNNVGVNGKYINCKVSSNFLYDQLNADLQSVSHKVRNLVLYFIDGKEHVFTNRPYYYTADATGVEGKRASSHYKGPSLQNFLERFPLRSGEKIRSVCHGHSVRSLNFTRDESERSDRNLTATGKISDAVSKRVPVSLDDVDNGDVANGKYCLTSLFEKFFAQT